MLTEEEEERDIELCIRDALMPEELALPMEEEDLVCILNAKPNITYFMKIYISNKYYLCFITLFAFIYYCTIINYAKNL
jgi:hypothetical protein